MALSDDKLWDLWSAQGTDDMSCAEAFVFARTIEAEVRKQDDALIQQMLEALEAGLNEVNAAGQSEGVYFGDDKDVDSKMEAAINAARARLGEKT